MDCPSDEVNEIIVANSVTIQDLDWCLDSRATNHMVLDEALFHELVEYSGIVGVVIGSGDK